MRHFLQRIVAVVLPIGLGHAALAAPDSIQHPSADDLLYESTSFTLYNRDRGLLTCTGCRYRQQSGNKPSTDLGPQVLDPTVGRLQFHGTMGDLVLLHQDDGTSCPPGDWYVLRLSTLKLARIKLPDCTEVMSTAMDQKLSDTPTGGAGESDAVYLTTRAGKTITWRVANK